MSVENKYYHSLCDLNGCLVHLCVLIMLNLITNLILIPAYHKNQR